MHHDLVALLYGRDAIADLLHDTAAFVAEEMRNELCVSFIALDLLQLGAANAAHKYLYEHLTSTDLAELHFRNDKGSTNGLQHRSFHAEGIPQKSALCLSFFMRETLSWYHAPTFAICPLHRVIARFATHMRRSKPVARIQMVCNTHSTDAARAACSFGGP